MPLNDLREELSASAAALAAPGTGLLATTSGLAQHISGVILFLSGGLSEEDASLCLHTINQQAAAGSAPWHPGFSFGRALQHSCLQHWGGHDTASSQATLLARARANGAGAERLRVDREFRRQ